MPVIMDLGLQWKTSGKEQRVSNQHSGYPSLVAQNVNSVVDMRSMSKMGMTGGTQGCRSTEAIPL